MWYGIPENSHVVKRIRQTNTQPRKPDQRRRNTNPPRLKQTLQMHPDLRKGEASVGMRPHTARPQRITTLQLFKRERARTVVLRSNTLECLDNLSISAFANEELWRFLEANNGETGNGHDEDEGAVGVPDVAPAFVVFVGAGCDGDAGGGVVGEEGPGEETGDELADAPPGRHECQDILLLAGEIL